MASTAYESLIRKTRDTKPCPALFDKGDEWQDHWWGMPHFAMGDARPSHKITINFLMLDDVKKFAEQTGFNVTAKTDSMWFPEQRKLRGELCYDGPKTDSMYPVCIPSKGRHDCQKTGHVLDSLGVSHLFFVEDTEYELYRQELGESRVVKMPFHDLGKGSIPARNFIWDWAERFGHRRHWVVDDNIKGFGRCDKNRRLCVYGGGFFRAMEDFVDRYSNVALAGPHDKGFVMDRDPGLTPYMLNSRVYSCILIDTSLKHRWRGRYNEDTDLSLRLLKDGFCTVLFRALYMDKDCTAFAKGRAMKGGNTDNVYNTGDSRLAFAESLKEQHPDCVEVVWKFGRWHHQVDYSRFKANKLIQSEGITPVAAINDYGMRLVESCDIESE